ncbi:hypothetical protein CTA2_10332 [Colletotrichum tanaceti]|uniref:Uncharacterized protein n=1 Tax=Colletotrichum tanaceti TaxID=1306861 RepID=A0A4U6X5C6_9PEZI|nr:hypothetical protein CTA2_10332 [Colletotrichum tanaceti]TKW50029.1 hypothetical protein CTA1_273 [Colletotrichum tanaceti]
MPFTTGASKRFELPKLDFKFGSLTEGTNIPPPLPSPVQEVPTPPQTPRVSETKESDAAVKGKLDEKPNGHHTAAVPDSPATTNGTKGYSDDTPLSPAASSRQGSIRRLFSRTLLNQAYAEGENHSNGNGGGPPSRPMSRSQGSIVDEKKSKRSSGWFKRLRTSETSPPQRRSSVVYEHPNISETSSHAPSKPKPQAAPQIQGPPPPMIPELSDVTDGGSLGEDLFKNIK